MAQRLGWIVAKPASWLSWHPALGGREAESLVTRLYPDAQRFRQLSQAHAAQAAPEKRANPWWSPKRWTSAAQPWPHAGVGMVWANMALHQASDPQAQLAHWHSRLAVDGFLMFSCLGPDTLQELRALYTKLGWPAPAHEFTDMHDWGDMLVQAGFAEPVMDMERIELTFATPQRLLQELRELGRNCHVSRPPGLRGRAWQQALLQGLQTLAEPVQGGQLKLTFEIVYGHAYKPQPRLKVASETSISLQDMRSHLKAPGGLPGVGQGDRRGVSEG
jgi:malonyl-CoA O-methyltransferase